MLGPGGQQREVAEQRQGLIGWQLGLCQQRARESRAVLIAAHLASTEQLAQVPKPSAPAQLLGLEFQAALQQSLTEACLQEEIGNVAPGGQISGIAAAEEESIH